MKLAIASWSIRKSAVAAKPNASKLRQAKESSHRARLHKPQFWGFANSLENVWSVISDDNTYSIATHAG